MKNIRSLDWQSEFVLNPLAKFSGEWTDAQGLLLNDAGLARATQEIKSWPEYASTPVFSLPDIASALHVSLVNYKDEGERFGINSFKVLGGAYGVMSAVKHQAIEAGLRCDFDRPLTAKEAKLATELSFVCATDGNHGRAVAWGSRRVGAACHIVLPSEVSEGRKRSLKALGAELTIVDGNFDHCVRLASRLAADNGWILISDTPCEGGEAIANHVMQGYEIVGEEALVQLQEPPTHVFLQAGVGGFAAAITASLKRKLGDSAPRIITVEPSTSACVFESIRSGTRTDVSGNLKTLMGGLACGEVSAFAWEILRGHLFGSIQVPDDRVADCMKILFTPTTARPQIVAGESAVAGLIGAISAAITPATRAAFGIDHNSRFLVFGTEGATDYERFRELVGESG